MSALTLQYCVVSWVLGDIYIQHGGVHTAISRRLRAGGLESGCWLVDRCRFRLNDSNLRRLPVRYAQLSASLLTAPLLPGKLIGCIKPFRRRSYQPVS